MKKAGWDTETGYAMFIEGKKDSEIADAFGIKTSIVTTYRKRHWEGVVPKKTLKEIRNNIKREENSEATAQPEEQFAPKASPLAEMIPIQEFMKSVENTAPDTEQTVIEPEQTCEPVTVAAKLGLMDVIELATEHLTGIRAVCTANVIEALWNWRTPEDLRKALRSMEYLLQKVEKSNG